MHQVLSLRRWLLINFSLFLCLVFVVLLFSCAGSPFIHPSLLLSDPQSALADIFWHARLPRLLLSVFVGMALSSSGVAFQSLLRNPLADPYILGVSGGAALGGVLGVALHLSFHYVPLMAFVFALGSVFLIYRLAQVQGSLPAYSLLLTGVMFNAFAFALILLINSLVSLGEAHQILYLLMGSLDAQPLEPVLWVGALILIGFLILISQVSHMNVISLGEEPATQLGLSVDRHRKLIFLSSSIMVGAAVSLSGLIGFVGLFVPHVVRLFFGSDHRLVLPASALGGGIFLVSCDFLSKTLFSGASLQTQLPVGVVTALIGGPLFVYLMKKQERE